MLDPITRHVDTLERFVRLMLLGDWDPIGIFGEPSAVDEYDSYAFGICGLMQRGATEADLVAHLDRIAKDQMGLSDYHPGLGQVAEKLLRSHGMLG